MKKVLIIYKHVTVGELLAEDLAAAGYLVVPISRPALAGDMMNILRPDLVLLDLQIDEKERSDVLREIEQRDPNLRVLAFTAYDGYTKNFRLSLADACIIENSCSNGLREKVAEVFQREPVDTEERKRTENLHI